jgi:crotonobetainyl-CoA:carnitine CoA-transferase CaiB-like acyl-CoA transferase
MMDFFQTRDNRWIFLHAGRDHFHESALKLLQCEETTESLAAAISRWEAQPLEDAFDAGGCMAVIARSIEEWASHPQGKILKDLPVVEVIKIGDSPPEPLGRGLRPLSGVRVLDVTNVLSGPTCGRTLAEHGADVLRVDSPDDTRMKPLTFLIDTGHGKRSTFLNLRHESDYRKMLSLIAKADIFSENYRLGKMGKLGLSAEAVAKLRPGIIYTSLNCYSYEGPWRERSGMEQIGQTAAGLAKEEGSPDRPGLLPGAITDYTSGYLAAFGTMVALYRRACEGGSYYVRTSLTQSAMLLGRTARVTQSKEQVQGLEISSEEISKLSETVETPYGTMIRLAPVVQLSETPACWILPPVPLGTHPPQWL